MKTRHPNPYIERILKELKQRWSDPLCGEIIPNVISFLNFRLKEQIPDNVFRKKYSEDLIERLITSSPFLADLQL